MGSALSNVFIMGPPFEANVKVGKELARNVMGKNFQQVGVDYLEPYWGLTVQQKLAELRDAAEGEDEESQRAHADKAFLAAEAEATRQITGLHNTVLLLTGSNPYSQEAMKVLKSMGGPVVYLDPDPQSISDPAICEPESHGPLVCRGNASNEQHLLWRSRALYEQYYDLRINVGPDENPRDIALRIKSRLDLASWFRSTRGGGGPGTDMLLVLQRGLCEDGGLYFPEHLPRIELLDLRRFIADHSYPSLALRVLEFFCYYSPDLKAITPQELRSMIHAAYHPNLWDHRGVVPVTSLDPKKQLYLIELFHGPTCSFKDIALQLFPKLFSRCVVGSAERYVVLTATSGDTGVAAIHGFKQQHVPIMVLFPDRGVQRNQMMSLNGGTVRVVPVAGDFDFCQSTVKGIFNSKKVTDELYDRMQTVLTSANSINWGRLLPQTVYYIWSYLELVRRGVVTLGDKVNVCVPTGNFGNILCAYMAGQMGLPVKKFICASNVNNVLTEFLTTGKYNLTKRHLVVTESPSIDILRSSNIERFLFMLSGKDHDLVKKLMNDLDKKKAFEVPQALVDEMNKHFHAGFCDEDACKRTIRDCLHETGKLIDTHTAVALKVAHDYHERKVLKHGDAYHRPTLIASTAHWAKFPHAVLRCLGGNPGGRPVVEVHKEVMRRAEDVLRAKDIMDKKIDPGGELNMAPERRQESLVYVPAVLQETGDQDSGEPPDSVDKVIGELIEFCSGL